MEDMFLLSRENDGRYKEWRVRIQHVEWRGAMSPKVQEVIRRMFPTSETVEYCMRCNRFTLHTMVMLPDRTAWVCKQCDEVYTSKDPED